MLKYYLAATALRAFSTNAATKRAYRLLANKTGGKHRAKGIKPGYIERADHNLAYIERHGAIADGMAALELGTGWVHWESLFTSMFYDVRVTLFDVWDNRQFDGFQFYAAELRRHLRDRTKRPAEQLDRAEKRLDEVLRCASFDEVYALLGWTYLVDPQGSLDRVPDNSLDLVYSSDVMEHVPRDALPHSIAGMARALRPGGVASHHIVETDHLTIYDRSVHSKNYMRYTDRQWKRWFENDVQYINRVQHSEFRDAFKKAGFEIVAEEVVSRCNSSAISIAPEFAQFDREDLDAAVTRVLARKPLQA